MVTVDDLAAAVRTLLLNNSAFAAALPGNAWFRRGPEPLTVWPYGVFKIADGGDVEFCSDGSYLQTWHLTLAAFTRQNTDAVPNAIQTAMNAALNSVPGQASPIVLRSGTVLHCLPRGVDGDFDPKLWDGRSIFVAAGSWEILLEGNVGT